MTGTRDNLSGMRKSEITCPECGADYCRIELTSRPGTHGEFRCLTCDHVIEVFDSSTHVVLRLDVQPGHYVRAGRAASVGGPWSGPAQAITR